MFTCIADGFATAKMRNERNETGGSWGWMRTTRATAPPWIRDAATEVQKPRNSNFTSQN